jgi:cyclophilin family peptidyl-prolyl cis-trans isomerase
MGAQLKFTLAALAAAVLLSSCGGSGSSTKSAAGACRAVSPSSANPALTHIKAPQTGLPAGSVWSVTVETNCGSFSFKLNAATAPKAAAGFIARAQSGFYNDLAIFRLAPGFLIQTGDPLNNSTGGPGYVTVDTPAASTVYPRGTVAMAKSADQPAGAAGSQFFVVTGESGAVTPDYAVVGSVTEGLAVADRISTQPIAASQQSPGAQPDGPPAHPIVIRRLSAKRIR